MYISCIIYPGHDAAIQTVPGTLLIATSKQVQLCKGAVVQGIVYVELDPLSRMIVIRACINNS